LLSFSWNFGCLTGSYTVTKKVVGEMSLCVFHFTPSNEQESLRSSLLVAIGVPKKAPAATRRGRQPR
jgi:hypothetical protein